MPGLSSQPGHQTPPVVDQATGRVVTFAVQASAREDNPACQTAPFGCSSRRGRRNPGREPLRPRRARGAQPIRGRQAKADRRSGKTKWFESWYLRREACCPLLQGRRAADSALLRPGGDRRNAGRDSETGSSDLPGAQVLRRSKFEQLPASSSPVIAPASKQKEQHDDYEDGFHDPCPSRLEM